MGEGKGWPDLSSPERYSKLDPTWVSLIYQMSECVQSTIPGLGKLRRSSKPQGLHFAYSSPSF